MAGRKPIYSKLLVRELCKLIKQGVSLKDAAYVLGIGEATIHNWKQKTLKNGLKNRHFKPELVESIYKAKLKHKFMRIDRIDKAAEKDWKADKWVLERQYPQEFSKKKIIEKNTEEVTIEFLPYNPSLEPGRK